MADDRADISGTIIGAPIVVQQLTQYILTDDQDADCFQLQVSHCHS